MRSDMFSRSATGAGPAGGYVPYPPQNTMQTDPNWNPAMLGPGATPPMAGQSRGTQQQSNSFWNPSGGQMYPGGAPMTGQQRGQQQGPPLAGQQYPPPPQMPGLPTNQMSRFVSFMNPQQPSPLAFGGGMLNPNGPANQMLNPFFSQYAQSPLAQYLMAQRGMNPYGGMSMGMGYPGMSGGNPFMNMLGAGPLQSTMAQMFGRY